MSPRFIAILSLLFSIWLLFFPGGITAQQQLSTYLKEFDHSFMEVETKLTREVRSFWQSTHQTKSISQNTFPDESKLKKALVYERESWSIEQKQVYLLYTFMKYKEAARQDRFSSAHALSPAEDIELNKTAFIEMAKAHNGFGFKNRIAVGSLFPNITNMEIPSSLGTLNIDWLFTIATYKKSVENFSADIVPVDSKYIYFPAKMFWGIVREEEPDLSSANNFFIKSNLNALAASEHFFNGMNMRDLFPDLKNKSSQEIAELYAHYFSNSEYTIPVYTVSPARKLGGISLAGDNFEFKYFHNGAQGDKNYCVYKSSREITGDPSIGAVSQDIIRLWHQLPRQKFWVNLHPQEPNRVLDKDLMQTLCGYILARADFQLKQDIAWMLFPDSALGKQYWKGFYELLDSQAHAGNKMNIPVSFRVWLVPGTDITVYANEQEIFIRKASWEVLLENERAAESNGNALSSKKMEQIQRYSSDFLKTYILPALKSSINTSPKYARLRELLCGAIIAAWSKHYNIFLGTKPDHALLSDHAVDNVFKAYLKSYNEGEYNFTKTSQAQNGHQVIITSKTYFNGGIDLSNLSFESFEQLSLTALTREQPELINILISSVYHPFGIAVDNEYWIGSAYKQMRPRQLKPLFQESSGAATDSQMPHKKIFLVVPFSLLPVVIVVILLAVACRFLWYTTK